MDECDRLHRAFDHRDAWLFLVPGAFAGFHTGLLAIHNDSPPGSFKIPGVETTLGREIKEFSEIVTGDPLSSRWQQSAQVTFARGEWQCALSSEYELTATETDYHLREMLRASLNGREIFKREEKNVVPRDLA
jgi:hypothetical protein